MKPINPALLQAFVTVAEAGSFTGAAESLSLRQSTISQQVRRLEDETGRQLFDRDTHRVRMTPAGEALLDLARQVLSTNLQLSHHLERVPLRGRLRFGASEDFVLSALPDVLAAFARAHPEVDLEVSAGLSELLFRDFDAGLLDVLLAKRGERDPRGRIVWRERGSWIGRPGLAIPGNVPLPLLLYPVPSITRAMAMRALEAARRPWHIAFSSSSLNALTAAARAGLGIMPHSARLIPPGLATMPDGPALPSLGDIEFVLVRPSGRSPVADALEAAVTNWAASGRTMLP